MCNYLDKTLRKLVNERKRGKVKNAIGEALRKEANRLVREWKAGKRSMTFDLNDVVALLRKLARETVK